MLILISRMLALVFLVMVFAQPYIPNEKNTPLTENPFVAVYIDNSFSMDAEGKYGILLEAAKVKAKELTDMFPRNTRYLLVTNEFLLMHQRFVNSEQFVDWVSQINSTHIVRTLDEVLDKISGNLPLQDSNIVPNVFLLTDFQKNILNDGFKIRSGNLKIFGMPFFNETEGNIYIDSVWFETQGHYKGKQEKIHARIQNISKETYTEIPVQLFINDSLRSSVLVNIDASDSEELVIPFVQWNAGNIKAHVEISDYPITFDNKLFFNFEIRDIKEVLIIEGNNSEKYLSALFKGDENIHSTSVGLNDIPFNTFNNYQVIVLNELENLSTGLINESLKFANQGGTLVFIPSLEGNLKSYKMLFDNLKYIHIDAFIEQEGNFKNVDFQNELFKSAFNSDLNHVRYPHYKGFYPIALQQRANAKVLFKAESGNPLFVQVPVNKGQCYLSALSLNSKSTDLATHPLFVPLFYNLVLYSSSYSELFYSIKPGLFSQVTRKSSSDGAINIVEDITGRELKPKSNITQQYVTIFPEIGNLSAGHYSLLMGGVFQDYLSYNYDRSESDISYHSMDEVKDLFKSLSNLEIEMVDANSKKLTKIIQRQSQGKPLRNLFLVLTLFMLIAEMFLLRFLK